MKYFLSRSVEVLLALSFVLLNSSDSLAENYLSIFEVQKNLKLSNDEPDFKDYYISGGYENGLKKGMVVDVIRKVPLHDNVKNQSKGNLVLQIGKVQIIHVQKQVSVARFYKGTTDDKRPLIQFNAIMVGDSIDMSTAVVWIKKKRKKPRKIAAVKKPKRAVKKKVKKKVKSSDMALSPPMAQGPLMDVDVKELR